jgi:photosystem II stability/assembly factor-like uncharacterized protein
VGIALVGIAVVTSCNGGDENAGDEEASRSAVIAGWRALGPNQMQVTTLVADASRTRVLYAGGFVPNSGEPESAFDIYDTGLFMFRTAAAGWIPVGDPGGAPESFVVDPGDSRTLYVAAGYLADYQVFKSTDRGSSWWRADRGLLGGAAAIAADPRGTGTLYAVGERGVSKTTDGGRSWELVARQVRTDGHVGAPVVVAVDPSDPDTVYAGGTRLYKSTDAGRAWRLILRGEVSSLAFDPRHAGTVFVVRDGGLGKSPIVVRTRDGGRTWKNVSRGVGVDTTGVAAGLEQDFEHLSAAPDGSALYVTATSVLEDEATIFESTSQGAAWRPVARTNTTVNDEPLALWFTALAVGRDRRVYAGTHGAGVFVCTSCNVRSRP